MRGVATGRKIQQERTIFAAIGEGEGADLHRRSGDERGVGAGGPAGVFAQELVAAVELQTRRGEGAGDVKGSEGRSDAADE